jgi:tRNA uridine 5-carboxymethylaminomethyl modification enzyme
MRRDWFVRRENERGKWDDALNGAVSAPEMVAAGLPVRDDGAKRSLREWLRFGGVELGDLAAWLPQDFDLDSEIAVEMAEDAAYAPYLARQETELRDLRASEAVVLG